MAKRIVIAGGGTGGHIFPAVAVANALRKLDASVDILFIGARGKMEMEKVPKAGYPIEGLTIAGFDRGNLLANWQLPFKLLASFGQVHRIFRRFRPHAAFGVGGYSSYPVLRYAQRVGIPTYLHEANAFGGKSNTMLSRRAVRVFAGTHGMERFFPASKLLFTGNPVRQEILNSRVSRAEALAFFGLEATKTTLLVVGGSLGALSVNKAIAKGIDAWLAQGYQLIWQTGKPFAAEGKQVAAGKAGVFVSDFITEMDKAYAAADMVISRAGAMSVTELCLAGKAVIFVPFPYAAEDHQTANARALTDKDAAWMVPDAEAADTLIDKALALAANAPLRRQMEHNVKHLAAADADVVIATIILEDLNKK